MTRHIVARSRRRDLRGRFSALAAAAILSIVPAVAAAQESHPASAPKAAAGGKAGADGNSGDLERLKDQLERNRAAAEQAAKRYTGDLDRDMTRLRNFVDQVPQDLRRSDMPTTTLHTLIDEIIASADEVLGGYAEFEPQAEAFVRYQRARAHVINHRRWIYRKINENPEKKYTREEQQQLLYDYLKEPYDDVERASTLVEASALASRIEFLRGQMFYFANQYEESAKVYEKLVQSDELPNRAEAVMAYIGSLERAQRHEDCLAQCEKYLADAELTTSEYTPHVLNVRQKMFTYLGRCADVIRHFDDWGTAMQQAFAGKPVDKLGGHVFPAPVAADFETFIDRAPFQRAFIEFAAGDIFGAQQSVDASIEHFKTKAEKGPLRPEANVFLNRSNWLKEVLSERVGQDAPPIAPVDWVTDPIDMAGEKGKVTLLLFFPYQSPRHVPFLQATEKFLADNADRGLRAAWVATPKGRATDVATQKYRLLVDANQIGVSFPVGLARIEEGDFKPAILDPYSATYGTATLVVVDRAGKIAWAKQDPTFRDFGVANVVVERLLSSKAPE